MNRNFVCCGQHAVCEQELLLDEARESADYFDDEELDRFAGRSSESYTLTEEEEFREILFTTLPGEVADWLKSLEQRGVELPASVREEAMLIVSEQRFGGE